MFIRLFDQKNSSNMLVPLTDIVIVKDYMVNEDNPTMILGARSVVMTRPVGEQSKRTKDYFVAESVDEIEQLINQALQSL